MTIKVQETVTKIRDAWHRITSIREAGRDVGVELSSGRTRPLSDLRQELLTINFGQNQYIEGYRDAIYDILSALEAATIHNQLGMSNHATLEANVAKSLGPLVGLPAIERELTMLYQKANSVAAGKLVSEES